MRDEVHLTNTTEVIRGYLTSENEVIRCAALQAYLAQLPDPEACRALLREALTDPDPDLRSDAMEALAEIATPADLPAIRRSLTGDPVREVKLAALRALGRLGEAEDIDLMRALVLSRCEDRVAWEDDLSDWEDWLDIQVAAIAALGQLGATDCIENLFTARDDPQGQTLDTVVFDALGQMGSEGLSWLLAVVQTDPGLGAKRALDALSKLAPEMLIDHIDTLLAQSNPNLRLHAVAALDASSETLAGLAQYDPAPEVRRVALQKAAKVSPELALNALRDPDASVQATALDLLAPPHSPKDQEAVKDNLCAWVTVGPSKLAAAAARNLPRLAPERAEPLLIALAQNQTHGLDAAVTAVRALSELAPPLQTSVFGLLLANPAQQVRIAALVALKDRSAEPDARACLVAAISETLLSDDEATRPPPDSEAAQELGAPKGEGAGASRVRITRTGDIVTADADDPGEGSTLAAILTETTEAPTSALAEDTPEESAPKRKKRRPVEGPLEIARTLALDAIRLCGGCPGDDIETALLARVESADTEIRRTATIALSASRTIDSDAAKPVIDAALADGDPQTRFHAFKLRDFGAGDDRIRAQALADADPLIRAEAVARMDDQEALRYVTDPAATVRAAAIKALLNAPEPAVLQKAFEALEQGQQIDTLATLTGAERAVREMAIAALNGPDITAQRAYVLLRALAGQIS
ncbi:HEAT repeat domain-containing protein [Roseobacter sp. A03A-229]